MHFDEDGLCAFLATRSLVGEIQQRHPLSNTPSTGVGGRRGRGHQPVHAGADPEGPSGGGDATQVAYLQEENGPFAYLPGGAPELQGEGGDAPIAPPPPPPWIRAC